MEPGHQATKIKAMRIYAITLKHDRGTAYIETTATSSRIAKHKIMEAEGCPERAIVKIERITKSIFDN
tara:strand:- start:480 stop:683 length:204 start_codon:yes stop_codon:yes gene_type:complete